MFLAKYLTENGTSETAFATKLGVFQATINRYINNKRFPDPEMIARIADATEQSVTVADWHEQAALHRMSKQETAA